MIQDLDHRQRARLSLTDNIVVEAGAGTGKTTLLTDRLLFMILAGGPERKGVDITRLVALTFTEKAAGEITLRLSEKLNDLVAALDGRSLPEARQKRAQGLLDEINAHFHRPSTELREQAQAALQHMDRAQIGTIHSFATHLLRLYPLESGLMPDFDVDAQETFFDDLFSTEWALWLDSELGEAPPRRRDWLEVLALAPLEDLENAARALCRENSIQGGLGSTPAMQERLKKLLAEFVSLPNGKPKPSGKIVETIGQAGDHLRALVQIFATSEPALSVRPARSWPESKWPKAWEALEGRAIYEEGLALAKEASASSEVLARKAVALLLPFAESFREKYRWRGGVTFDGLLTRARALVRDHADVRQALKKKFDALLIDEFQDTDPLQGELLLFLAEEIGSRAARWQDIRFAPGKIFVVGDPKQSIYRFRGADIRAYEQFTKLLLDQGAVKCDLQTNFRSNQGIVAPINAAFERLMREEAGLQPRYLPIHPRPEMHSLLLEKEKVAEGRMRISSNDESSPQPSPFQGEGGPSVEMVLVAGDGGSDDDFAVEDAQRAEARWMADWILSHGVEESKPGQQEKFLLRNIAVLLRSTSILPVLLQVFKERGVPYVVEADRYFYGTQEAADFLNLLRVLDAPHDKTALVGLLRSPLLGLEDREIYALSRVDGLSYLTEDWRKAELSSPARRRLESFWEQLRRFHARAGKDSLGDFVQTLLRDSFVLEVCTAAYNGEQTLSNLLKFGRLAAEAGDSRGVTLKEFIAEAVKARDEAVQEGESPMADEHLPAVRILTIHKAKGLEFDAVLVPNLSGRKGGGGERPVCRRDWSEGTLGFRLPQAQAADLAWAFLDREEKRREEREQVRLLYVAMTRAREKMVLLGRAEDAQGGTLAGLLRDAGAWVDEDRPSAISWGEGVSIPVEYIPPDYKSTAASVNGKHGQAPAPDLPALAALWRHRQSEMETFRAKAIFANPSSEIHEKLIDPSPRENGQDPGAPAHLMGQLCHSVLEKWDFAGKQDLEPLLATAKDRLAASEPNAEWGKILAEARDILLKFIESPASRELARAEILGREMPFIMPKQDQVMRGSMDLLVRRDGKLWVVDYKTDRVAPGNASRLATQYEPQGRAYAEAVRAAMKQPCGFQVAYLRTGEIIDVFSPS